jgi:hypothetical protein
MDGWIVRNLAGSREAYEQISFEKSILLLRPFGQPYGSDNLEWVQACTEAALKDHKAKDKAREDWTPRIESIIDQVSPRLVGDLIHITRRHPIARQQNTPPHRIARQQNAGSQRLRRFALGLGTG